MGTRRFAIPSVICAAGMALVAIGAFLPWVTVWAISVSGLRGDGVLTLIAALVGAVILLVTSRLLGRDPGRGATTVQLVLAILTLVIGVVDLTTHAGSGLYLTLVGGLIWTAGAVWSLIAKPAQASPRRSDSPTPAATTTDTTATAEARPTRGRVGGGN